MKYAIIGNGELANQIKLFLRFTNDTDVIFFDDNNFKEGKKNSFVFSDYGNDKFKDYHFLVCLGYKHLEEKNKIIKQLFAEARNLVSFIHPTAFISPHAIIEPGVFIYPCCNVDKDVIIKKGCLLNNSVVISHNSIIGDNTYVSPGVVISGNVAIGHSCFIGTGSIISNNITIGDNVLIGVGSVITRDVADGSHVIGNPMKITSKPLRLK